MAEGGFEIGHWPHVEAWADRLKAMPGFALPYDLIPSKDREFPAAPHYSPKWPPSTLVELRRAHCRSGHVTQPITLKSDKSHSVNASLP